MRSGSAPTNTYRVCEVTALAMNQGAQAWYPGSFTGAVEPARARDWMELLFLSFTTLSGVGLGDVVPLGAQARALVMLEEFAGVGYIATVVSRLIGLTLLSRAEKSAERAQREAKDEQDGA